jgi:hypothetical protein
MGYSCEGKGVYIQVTRLWELGKNHEEATVYVLALDD